MRFSMSLAALLGAGAAQAYFLVSELSFGYAGRISPADNPGHIANFAVSGQPGMPEILSSKVILTPVAPGNARGAIWSENPLVHSNWIIDVDFRASGPDRAGGNLNIWVARDGKNLGTRSVYNAGRFDGLVLVIDSHGGQGGMLRGFLNDGSTDFSQHHNVDSLAFGHCQFSYRNLGRPAQIKLRQRGDGFRVQIDGKTCFETSKVSLPKGNFVGITASTPDSPDSFEVFKMVVTSETSSHDINSGSNNNDNSNNNNNNNNNGNNNNGNKDTSSNSNGGTQFAYSRQQQVPTNSQDFEEVADQDADTFQSSKAQFQDLHNRLQGTNHQLASVYRSVSRHHQMDEQRHNEVQDLFAAVNSKLALLDQLATFQQRIVALENEVRNMNTELHERLSTTERSMHGALRTHHMSLTARVTENIPGHGKLIAVIIGTQVVLVGAYVVYKRRRANSPKKYL
ncbi:legume-like lectin family domain-containing protein [Trichoderma breve]|uniref:Legume-like lectin family domain-containing protein n=1 Tax=Trichoderma breve TaxID=2034170 RepID=A0A9W9E378_9HYPO|nr:legume-like lectin family domain-containing protein [Trichoderma breve]KAJ4855350.1 legume-like lectin family domain-containing protein [Trichoderma breve]